MAHADLIATFEETIEFWECSNCNSIFETVYGIYPFCPFCRCPITKRDYAYLTQLEKENSDE